MRMTSPLYINEDLNEYLYVYCFWSIVSMIFCIFILLNLRFVFHLSIENKEYEIKIIFKLKHYWVKNLSQTHLFLFLFHIGHSCPRMQRFSSFFSKFDKIFTYFLLVIFRYVMHPSHHVTGHLEGTKFAVKGLKHFSQFFGQSLVCCVRNHYRFWNIFHLLMLLSNGILSKIQIFQKCLWNNA